MALDSRFRGDDGKSSALEGFLEGTQIDLMRPSRARLGMDLPIDLGDAFYTAGFFATDYGVQPALAAPRSYFGQLIWTF